MYSNTVLVWCRKRRRKQQSCMKSLWNPLGKPSLRRAAVLRPSFGAAPSSLELLHPKPVGFRCRPYLIASKTLIHVSILIRCLWVRARPEEGSGRKVCAIFSAALHGGPSPRAREQLLQQRVRLLFIRRGEPSCCLYFLSPHAELNPYGVHLKQV